MQSGQCLVASVALACASVGALGVAGNAPDAPAGAPNNGAEHVRDVADATTTFDRLVERYRTLAYYRDSVTVEQVTARSGERAVREQTELRCRITPCGELEVTSPERQMGEGVGLGALVEDAVDRSLGRRYSFWLAPHLALRFVDHPLTDFRPGVEEGFTPVKTERVTVDDRELLRLDLHSGDGKSEDFRAKFELFINPETLLITRIRGVQLLPDGANLLTEFIIDAQVAVTSDGEKITKPPAEHTAT